MIQGEFDEQLAGVYSNGMSNDWLRSLGGMERELVLAKSKTVRVKRLEEWMNNDCRFQQTVPCKELYLSGNPNMVPVMIVDLLLAGLGPIWVTGTTFFLGEAPYRESQRRIFETSGAATDRYGSTGGQFERCRGISGHDQFVNRAVVRNLYQAGHVTGDSKFIESIEMSSHQYSENLDVIYGLKRR
jgi:hypothetical protein